MPTRPRGFPDEETHWRYEFRIPADAGQRIALCRTLWNHADEQDKIERLLFVEEWGVWPSGEHLPLFGSLRARFGEQRPLTEAPGQIFGAEEADDGLSFLIVCVLFLWDCWIFGSGGNVVMMSHDEYGLAFARKNRDSAGFRDHVALIENG
jgi:hypothetical protein